MRLKTILHFKAKVIEPCSKLLSIFKKKNKYKKPSVSSRSPTFSMPKRRKFRTKAIRFKKPFSLRACTFPNCKPTRLRKSRPSLSSEFKKSFRHKKHSQPPKKPVQKVRIAELMTVLFSLRKAKDLETTERNDQVMGDARSVSPSEGGHAKEPFPSPITPWFARKSDDSKKENSVNLEDAEDACKSFEDYLVEMIVDEGKVKDLKDVEELLYCWRNLKSSIFIDLVCRFYGELSLDNFAPSEETESSQNNNASE